MSHNRIVRVHASFRNRCTRKFQSSADRTHGYGRSSCDRSGGHLQHLQRMRNERRREGKRNGRLLLFFTTSTKYYLYTLVLSPPKSSELNAHIVRLVCTKSEILQKVPGCLASLNGLSGCNRGLAWATRKPRAKEQQGEWQGQSD